MRNIINKKQILTSLLALMILLSSPLQAYAYYEKDPELEYIRTSQTLLLNMDSSSEPFNVQQTVTGLNDYPYFNPNEFSRKVLLLTKSQVAYYVETTPIRYWLNSQNKLIKLNASLSIEFPDYEREADLVAMEVAMDIKSRTQEPRKMVELANQYLVDNVEYPRNIDYDDKILWNAYGALIEGRAVCEGYALAFTKILRHLDIPVINVLGTANGGGHMWNQVLIDGQWLHVDVAGMGKGLYGSSKLASKLDYSSVLLRSLAIHEGYTYQTSDVKAVETGILTKARAAFSDLSRGDVVFMTYNYLSM